MVFIFLSSIENQELCNMIYDVLLANGLKDTVFSNLIGINKKVVLFQSGSRFARRQKSLELGWGALPLCHHLKI
jgi:hypothetical protein